VSGVRHRTLVAVFGRSTRSDLRWAEIETLVRGVGGQVLEREGSRVAFILNGVRAVFHRPHPRPTASKGAVDTVRRLLATARVKP
jgi:hypothetical protein